MNIIARFLGIEEPLLHPYRKELACPVFLVGDVYYCCPLRTYKAPTGWTWHEVGRIDGRKVYASPAIFHG